MAAASTTRLDHGIIAVDTEYGRPLMDASHLIVENGCAAFVDTGVNDSVPMLLDALNQEGLAPDDVEYVFLTHVHLDHAGGAGLLMSRLPNARCVLHPRGAPHMIDPAKLIAGANAVYGEERVSAMYGELVPVDEQRVIVVDDGEWLEMAGRRFQAIYTEGHARHHYVLYDPASEGVFTGDSFGISYRELDTPNGEIIFPITTPIDFDPPEAHKSVDRIMSLQPKQVYLTHYSRVRNLDRLAADMHERIDAFAELALANEQADNRLEKLMQELFDYMYAKAVDDGFNGDRDALWSVIENDVVLNAQGLDVWLNRRHKM